MIELPVLASTNGATYTEEFKQYRGFVSVLAGFKTKRKTWRLGWMSQADFDANTKMKRGRLYITVK